MPEIVTQVLPGRVSSPTDSWWARYSASLPETGLSPTAARVVDLDSQYIVDQGVLGAKAPTDLANTWPANRLRRGLVIGSIQSGKTASMLGVVSKSLDAGIDIAVVLAGTRVALWRQTLARVYEQLDRWRPAEDAERGLARVLVPSPYVLETSAGAQDLETLYHAAPTQVRRGLERHRPLIAVVMKHGDHLIRFGKFLQTVLDGWLPTMGRPVHLLVLDDEADDGSILDAEVEAGLAPDSDAFKQIPRHIARLWSGRMPYHTTFDPLLFATYIAYTATPQANILQCAHNPLSPTDFVVALRTGFVSGNVEPPRTATFEEKDGLNQYFTGGDAFYVRASVGAGALCLPSTLPTRHAADTGDVYQQRLVDHRTQLLADSLRAYFTACAIRLLDSDRRLSRLDAMGPARLEDIRSSSPMPTSMLLHPSSAVGQHIRAAWRVCLWASGEELPDHELEERLESHSGVPQMNESGLQRHLEHEPERWRAWLDSYEAARRELASRFAEHSYDSRPMPSWEAVRETLVTEVFPHVRIRLINSSPYADDRPQFRPVPAGQGLYRPAPDLLSIFVSGNVMARGITLDGLTTTLFTRDADVPSADTQMQMQRWFGYRGSYLYLCRVFLYRDQLDLFMAYHENDEALRGEVLEEMNRRPDRPPAPMVLQGQRFRATAKISNLRALPLCPGPHPFVRLIATAARADHNSDVLGDLLDTALWIPLVVAGTSRGLIRENPLSLPEVAGILESLRYDHHDPSPLATNHRRWHALELEMALQPPVSPLFRSPNSGASLEAVSPQGCPYTIAAYLRLWSAALIRKARGLYPTDDYRTPWSMINLSSYAATAPMFWVGVRFGSAGDAHHARLARHGVQCVKRELSAGLLAATWGSRNPGEGAGSYLGDHLFDYHYTGLAPAPDIQGEPYWRPRGHPGLLLFHVIRTEMGESVTAGLALPLGGPDHFASLRDERPSRSSRT